MVHIATTLEQKLKHDLSAEVQLVVWTTHTPAQYAERLQAQGFRVIQTCQHINAITVKGQAHAALELKTNTWVACIEESSPTQVATPRRR